MKIIHLALKIVIGSTFILLLISCSISRYVPDDNSVQNLSVDDARRLVQHMGSYTKLENYRKNNAATYTIAAVHITTSRLIIDLNGGPTVEIFLTKFTAVSHCGHNGCVIFVDNNYLLDISNDAAANHLCEAFYKLKQATIRNHSPENDARFEQVAKAYNEAVVKPVLSEEVHRLKVQAEDAVQDKKFYDAADLYEHALEVAPWWPEGHFNRALVLGEVGEYGEAKREMEHYLQLVPDAPNARAVQDKIYSWERKLYQPN